MSSRQPSLPPSGQKPRANVFARAGSSLRISADFRYLWLSNLFFIGGNWALVLILSWYVFEVTHSEILLSIFTAIRLSPMWLGPISGLLADRYNRVTIIKIASLWSMSVTLMLGLLVSIGAASFPVLVICGFLLGMAQSPSQPSRSSLILELVGHKNLANANALVAMSMGLVQGIAPALGGLMIAKLDVSLALYLAALWYLAASVFVWRIGHVSHRVRVDHEPVISMLTGGLRIIRRNRLTMTVLVVTIAANMLIWPVYNSFMPVFAKDVLGLGADGLGRLLLFYGIGSFTGAFIIASVGDIRRKGALFVFGSMVWGCLWAMFGLSSVAILSFGLMFGIGLAGSAFGVMQSTLMLITSVPEVQGRALGILELAIGAMPIGTLFVGAVAAGLGVGMTTFLCGALFVFILVLHHVRVPDLPRWQGEEVEASSTLL